MDMLWLLLIIIPYSAVRSRHIPENDTVVFVSNPIESDFPGHWLPLSIVKKVIEMRVDKHKSFVTSYYTKSIATIPKTDRPNNQMLKLSIGNNFKPIQLKFPIKKESKQIIKLEESVKTTKVTVATEVNEKGESNVGVTTVDVPKENGLSFSDKQAIITETEVAETLADIKRITNVLTTIEMQTITEVSTTTKAPSTIELSTATEVPTLTEAPSTSELSTTTEEPTSTEAPSTTELSTTTEVLTSTEAPSTTGLPTMTDVPFTTELATTNEAPTTTEIPTMTEVPTITEKLSTTGSQTLTITSEVLTTKRTKATTRRTAVVTGDPFY